MDAEIPGFVTPVHRALTEPILKGSTPRSIAIINGTLAAALGIGLRLWITGVCAENLNTGVMVMKSAQDGA